MREAPLILEEATDLVSRSRPRRWDCVVPGRCEAALPLLPTERSDFLSSNMSYLLSLNSASLSILSSSRLRLSSVNLSFFKNFCTSLSMYLDMAGLSPYLSLNLLTNKPLSCSRF